MGQERLRGVELCSLPSDRLEAMVDDAPAPALTSMKNVADLGEAHPHPLARPDDEQTAKVFLGIVTMARGGPFGNDDTFVLPMAQHVCRNAEPGCSLSDPHPAIIAP